MEQPLNNLIEQNLVEDSLVAINKVGYPNLFMVHAASGLIFPYLKLKQLKLSLYAIGNPFYGKTNVFESIAQMAATYNQFIRRIQPSGPYYLGGWSFGGVIALEMAKQLIAINEPVDLVLMADSYNPQNKPHVTNKRYTDAERIIQMLRLEDKSMEASALRQQYCFAHDVLSLYTPQPYTGRVVLLKALYPDPPDRESVEYNTWVEQRQKDPYNGWHSLLPMLEVVDIHASHSRMFDDAHVDELITQIVRLFSNNH